jgi:hypothetical protein
MRDDCEKCGSTKIYGRVLDEGVSDELYRCADCGFTNDMPVAIHSIDLAISGKIAKATGAALLLPIDQSNNIAIKQHVEKYPGTGSGVCAMLVAYWIGYYYKFEDADEKFLTLVRFGLHQVVVDQSVYMSETSSRQRLAEDSERYRQKYIAFTGGTTPPEQLPPVMLQHRPEYVDLTVDEKRRKLWKKALRYRRAVNEAHEMEIRRMSLNMAGGTILEDDAPLAGLPHAIENLGPGMYAVNLHGSGNWFKRLLLTGSISSTGHVVAVQLVKGRYRFMDPNTGLWACDNQSMLREVADVHMTMLYNAMFKGGTYSIWRFPA